MGTQEELLEELRKELEDIEIFPLKCEICDYTANFRTPTCIQKHHIIPTEWTKLRQIMSSETIDLCCNCHIELHALLYSNYFSKLRKSSYQEILQMCKEAIDKLRSEKTTQNRIRINK